MGDFSAASSVPRNRFVPRRCCANEMQFTMARKIKNNAVMSLLRNLDLNASFGGLVNQLLTHVVVPLHKNQIKMVAHTERQKNDDFVSLTAAAVCCVNNEKTGDHR